MNRREFISKSGTVAGAGLVLGAPSVMAAAKGKDKINVALIGMGKQGRVLFESMSNIPGIHFQAVCDIWDHNLTTGRRKVKALQGHMPNGYPDIDDLLEKEKDLEIQI